MLQVQAPGSAAGLRVEFPDLLTGFGIESDHTMGGSGEVQCAVDDERRGFEGGLQLVRDRGMRPNRFTHVIGPGPLQGPYIAGVDLLQGRKPGPSWISSPEAPLLARPSRPIGYRRARRAGIGLGGPGNDT